MANYLFSTPRLGFRPWKNEDIPTLAKLNADPIVMEFFPSTYNLEQTADFVRRMKIQFDKSGFCYFPVDELTSGNLIGFIGLCEQNYEAPFTPCVDIGWRLAQQYWGKGYATEGAKACLEIGFREMGLKSIKSICSLINVKSERVMQKIGMQKVGEFKHPFLKNSPHLEECCWYECKKG